VSIELRLSKRLGAEAQGLGASTRLGVLSLSGSLCRKACMISHEVLVHEGSRQLSVVAFRSKHPKHEAEGLGPKPPAGNSVSYCFLNPNSPPAETKDRDDLIDDLVISPQLTIGNDPL
jgi:hypothetical protein